MLAFASFSETPPREIEINPKDKKIRPHTPDEFNSVLGTLEGRILTITFAEPEGMARVSLREGGNLYSDLKAKSGIAYVDGGDKGGAGAHAWVCDGGEDMQKITRYLKYDGTYEDHVEHNYCYHFNWGWNGLYNGYFNAGVFDTSKGRSRYDFSISPGFFVVYK